MARVFRNDKIGHGAVLDVDRDDRGRLVAELWDERSGKTIGITEVDSAKPIAAAEHWAKETLRIVFAD